MIVSRPIPFKLVREIWFCVHDLNDLYAFGISEKILEDYELEDEVVMEYLPSLITIKYRNERPALHVVRKLLSDQVTRQGPENSCTKGLSSGGPT